MSFQNQPFYGYFINLKNNLSKILEKLLKPTREMASQKLSDKALYFKTPEVGLYRERMAIITSSRKKQGRVGGGHSLLLSQFK